MAWRRALTGLPYLGASFLAQSGFKETVMAMLVVALGIVLHLALRREGEDREAPPARAVVGVIAAPRRGVRLHLLDSRRRLVRASRSRSGRSSRSASEPARSTLAGDRAAAREHRALLIGGAVALVALALIAIGPARDFIDKIDEVQGSSGRLSSPVFPGEALGIWPEGDFRVVRGEVDGSLLATAVRRALCAGRRRSR